MSKREEIYKQVAAEFTNQFAHWCDNMIEEEVEKRLKEEEEEEKEE